MRRLVLPSSLALALCSTAFASGTFIPVQTPNVQLSRLSPNGAYAVGSEPNAAAFRWTAATLTEELIPEMNEAMGINDSGTITGSIPENGGANDGGRDLGVYATIGAAPTLLTSPLSTNSDGYDIAADGTVVGLSFDDNFSGSAVAFVWNAADGMSALPVLRASEFSRANAISGDGHVIAGWNDGGSVGRNGVIWIDRVPFDVVDADGNGVGEATSVSVDGTYVVGSEYTDSAFNSGAWRWSAADGVVMIPGMTFAFAVSGDGKTVVGATGFFDDPPRAPMVWREGVGTTTLQVFLTDNGISVPEGWEDLSGGLTAISSDGLTLAGWIFGTEALRSYVIRIDPPAVDAIFADDFETPAPTP